jgi:hypothetical protein
MDIIVPKKNVVLDATVMTSLMNCGRFADLRFNHNLVSIKGKSNSLEVGSIVHKFLEVYYGTIIQGLKKEDALGFGMTAAELYITGCKHCTDFIPSEEQKKPTCGHKPNDYPGVRNTHKEPLPNRPYDIGWQWALDTCQQYHEFYRSDHWVSLEVETVKSAVLYEDESLRILWKAKLDWVVDTNQGIYSVDHKTMKQRRDTVALNNQFIGQALIMKTRGVFVNKVGFQKTLKPHEKFTREIVPYSSESLLEWQGEILPYYANLLLMYTETEYFPPNYSNCDGKFGNCIFMDVCKSNPSMREEELKINFKVGPEWNPTNDSDE